MRAVAQRVRSARVDVDGALVSSIGQGLLVYLGAGRGDTERDVEYVSEKLAHLRVFEDESGAMNLSVLDIRGEVLVVSQFTLYGDVRRGRRPSFTDAAPPEEAERLYERCIVRMSEHGVPTRSGRFRAMMAIHSENWGPVTILMDSRRCF